MIKPNYFLHLIVNREVETPQGFSIPAPFCAFWQYDSGNIFMDVWVNQKAYEDGKSPLKEIVLKNSFGWAPEFYEKFEGETDEQFRDRIILHLFRRFNVLAENEYEIIQL